jgi:hypothetical protein
MSISSKRQFKNYYKDIWKLLYNESARMKEYNIISCNKKYFIKFEYSIYHSSVIINNFEIFIYMHDTIKTLDLINNIKHNNIYFFIQENKLTYKHLLLIFKKIEQSINQNYSVK